MKNASTPAAIALLVVAAALAQGTAPIVYPAKGQSAEQQAKDKNECAAWAKESTGIDPAAVEAAPAPAAPPPAEKSGPKGERLKGAARGAAAGAVIGEVADDDADEGAKVGAAAGALAGGRQARKGKAEAEEQAEESAQQAQQQAEAAKQEKLQTYGRAVAACLEGRGYTVK
jgi:YMGG-like Gly-zipper